jgi:hypothetical protein
MTALATRFGGRLWGAGRRTRATARLCAPALACLLFSAPVSAQMFGDRPPPVPPATVPLPEGLGSGAVSLAPPGGPGSAPVLPPSILAPPMIAPAAPAAVPPAATAAPLPAANQAVLALSAKFGKDLPNVTGGVIWRIYADRPDASGAFRMLREERTPTPNIVLPPGSYVVHASLGLASAVRPVTLRQETTRELFEIPAGGLRIEGRVGTTRIPSGQVTFNIYKGSQFDAIERAPIAQNVPSGDVALIPEGTYYIISNYGDGNSVVRSDIRVQAGKLTDVTVTHRAALIVLKLVSERGGEALANTSWSVLTPGGDIVKESIGAFPRVVLAEGQYRAIARYEGRVYERSFDVVNGVDGEIEVLSR